MNTLSKVLGRGTIKYSIPSHHAIQKTVTYWKEGNLRFFVLAVTKIEMLVNFFFLVKLTFESLSYLEYF